VALCPIHSDAGLLWSAAYNGDGARLRQVTNGVPTTYTLDLAAPLVQVLTMQDAGGKTTYLYGVTRIGEQQPGGWAYHLADALGSVRQLADASAQVTLARGYMPYGEELWSVGDGSSAYGYTGEDWNTVTRLVFLRARYMQPGLGMFLSRDSWEGNVQRPGSMNGWNYVEGNPVNRVDPSGNISFRPAGVCPAPPTGYTPFRRQNIITLSNRGGSVSRYIFCGEFDVSGYQYVLESPYVKSNQELKIGKDSFINGPSLKTSGFFIEDVKMNGTGKLDVSGGTCGQGSYIHGIESNADGTISYHCGRGRPFDLSDMYKVVASDPGILPMNSQIYVPDLHGGSDLGGKGNPFFTVKDTGQAIGGRHIDVFVGEGPGILTGDLSSVPSLIYTGYHAAHGAAKTEHGVRSPLYQKLLPPWDIWYECLE
jgi:RHS repeat-associated protein